VDGRGAVDAPGCRPRNRLTAGGGRLRTWERPFSRPATKAGGRKWAVEGDRVPCLSARPIWAVGLARAKLGLSAEKRAEEAAGRTLAVRLPGGGP